MKHARQIIVHGHIYIGDTRIKFPSMIVPKSDEEKIRSEFSEAKLIKTGKQAQKMQEQEVSKASGENSEEKTE